MQENLKKNTAKIKQRAYEKVIAGTKTAKMAEKWNKFKFLHKNLVYSKYLLYLCTIFVLWGSVAIKSLHDYEA